MPMIQTNLYTHKHTPTDILKFLLACFIFKIDSVESKKCMSLFKNKYIEK